eukprot:jgi/Orpsp1_1/1187588/evm.model.d7180000058827.1
MSEKKDKDITDYLGFEYEPIPEGLLPDELLDFWHDEYELGKTKGFTPVIIPLKDRLEEFLEDMENSNNSKEDLPDVSNFFEKMKKDTPDMDKYIGEVTPGVSNNYLVSVIDYAAGGLANCVMIHLPTTKPWEAALLVPFGGFNDCPEPKVMAAVLKYWYEHYEAIPVAITHDTLEIVVPKPVSREKALELAKEHFLFCSDRIFQCTKTSTIGELAGDLSKSTI